ncbi:putative INO80 complex subunit C, partial [Hypsibius exemplaris]
KRITASFAMDSSATGASDKPMSSGKSKTKIPAKGGGGRFKAKARSSKKNGSSSALQEPDADMDDSINDGAPEKFGIHKKQKELPKPAITIFMHHPWPFKNQEYMNKRYNPIEDDKAQYRPLKHIIGAEKADWSEDPSQPAYWTIRAPPRLKPAKRYSDVSGFEANYTDPETKLHYCNAEEFEIIRSLTRDLVQSYLRLRGYVDIIG